MKKSILLLIFLGLFVFFSYLFGREEFQNVSDHSKIREAPGFALATSKRVVTGLDKSKRVIFEFQVGGRTYSTITSSTNLRGAMEYTSLPEYSKIIYDRRDPSISTLQHYYDLAERSRNSLGKTAVVISVLAMPVALVVTLLVWLIGLLVKRSRRQF